MSANQEWEFKLNSTPHLKMCEITNLLFNRNFHSDVQFSVGGKIIYAHSLELMKRSEVFEKQFQHTMGDNKLITVHDFKYEDFFEFIRFIYTDECDINYYNGIEILKLAIKYKVIALENKILGCQNTKIKWLLKMYEHCVLKGYQLTHKLIESRVKFNFFLCLNAKQFVLLHADVLDEILKFENVKKTTEADIFTAVSGWIASHCDSHQIALPEGRQQFDNLIRKIRFPTMTKEEIQKCYQLYPGLLNEDDCTSISRQIVFDGSCKDSDLWISKPREEFVLPCEFITFEHQDKFESTITVSESMILYGLRIGTVLTNLPIEIDISETNEKSCRNVNFLTRSGCNTYFLTVNLGNSLTLKPNCKYTISFKFLERNCNTFRVFCRNDETDVIINDPTVNLIEASPNMFEMFFKPVED